MKIKIVNNKINLVEISNLAKEGFGDMVKAVVDIEKRIIAIGSELHADAEALLIEEGSSQNNLWGINLYSEKPKEEMIEYTSLINIRPSQNNRSLEIENQEIRKKILEIINSLID